ncbi:helix-turn-helix transcriptional regulator [Wenxinia marina]|uniref:DNA-binding HTH domain-containing protein n=1 Tax=Wenxinia marina DSM 24838 TaxID=1123501 RepID=A0A0D0QHG8_9RHOB|nr:autoinducer binding domain-containing protein [Wenxinia marina]KIQ70518.1 DNA-binding HTH domain-containing protein [Wenxinia marina DSM 24838]GGL52506.1 histidine kinase [Wenxinia marina]
MSIELETFLETVESADSLDDLQTLIAMLRDAYAVDHIVYHWVSADGGQYGCGTYSLAWVDQYIGRDYIRIDPVVLGCFQRFRPVDWKQLDWSGRAARAFLQDAVEYGVGNQGYSIPIRGPQGQFAIFTVSHSCDDAEWRAFTDARRRDLILAAHSFNQKALDLAAVRWPEPLRTLSPRELDTLTFLSMGYSRGQVAEMLSISEHTLRAYVESARFKLGAVNTVHAVARAIALGLILTGTAARAAEGDWPGPGDPDGASASAR